MAITLQQTKIAPDFVNRLRLRQAVRLLNEAGAKVAAFAAALGIDSLSHFHRLFKRHYGLTPAAYRSSRQTFS